MIYLFKVFHVSMNGSSLYMIVFFLQRGRNGCFATLIITDFIVCLILIYRRLINLSFSPAFFCFFGVRDSAIYLRLSLAPLSKAIKLHNSLNRERTRLPYCFSISLADRLVVMWVWSFFEMYRSYRLNSISAMTLHSLP